MPRVRELTLDLTKVKISPLSWDETEAYVKEGNEMLARDPKPTSEEWAKRTFDTIAKSLNRAANATGGKADWDSKKLLSEFDILTIQELYEEILKMSGLKTQLPSPQGEAPGEPQATSTLP